MNEIQRHNDSLTENRQSQETSRNTPPVPDRDEAAILSSLIDRARAAMGWNRLQQSSERGESSEQDIHIITWFEILSDAGVPSEHWTACYRAAQQRKNKAMGQGVQPSIVTPNDLVVEWDGVKRMHVEIDKTRLLPSNAANACPNCFGTGMERMPNGSVRKGCKHEGWTPEYEVELERNEEQRREETRRQAEFMKDALNKVGSPKPVVDAPKPKQAGRVLICTNEACKRRVNTLYGFEVGESCNELLNRGVHDGDLKFCDGTLEVL